MSPAIMFCGASDDGERFAGLFNMCQILLSARWSFCLIGVLIGVVRVILLRGSVGWSFFHTENKTSRPPAPTAVTRATLGSCNECGARRALAYSAN